MSKKRQQHGRRNRPPIPTRPSANVCKVHFVDGAFFEVLGAIQDRYQVQFIDADTGQVVHQDVIANNHWVRTARKFFTRWHIRVTRAENDFPVFEHHYDCSGQRVYVAMESKSLGDTLAWLPAVEEFRLAHGCRMICSTFMNGLFREAYPEIEFVEPGTTVHNLYAMYRLGLFYFPDGRPDLDRNLGNVRERPLGKAAFDILGLDYQEIRPRVCAPEQPRPVQGKYVCIGVHSTAQAKYWNNPAGWKELVDYLDSHGYQVLLLSKEGMEHMGNRVPDGVTPVPAGPIATIVNYQRHADLFVGVGSGLSWLAWAVGCPTCLISGFSYPYSEPESLIRVFPQGEVCTGCFNRYKLDPGDWNWCPDHKGSERMFECSRRITSQEVIAALAPHLQP